MKKTILTILSVFLLQTCCMAFDSAIRFVQVTDVHFDRNVPSKVTVLKDTVNDINKLKDVSFVVFTGDNINHPVPEDLVEFVKIVNRLRVPYYVVLGNHDVSKSRNLSKERYSEIIRENNIFWVRRKWNYAFKKKGYTFIFVDGSKEIIPGPVGYYRKDTLEWLDKKLSDNKKSPVVILQHYPIIDAKEFGSARLKTHRTYEPEKYFEVLNKHNNVIAILSGHYHVNSETMLDGIYHITTPSLISASHSYKIIDIVSKKGFTPIIYTQLRSIDEE